MDTAESMYLGRQRIHASDPILKSHSCDELGLRCAYCGEPVFHKNGAYNQAHFSHFPSIDPHKYEECLIRQRNEGGFSISSPTWWDLDRGKGQRLILFQEHFRMIVRSSQFFPRDIFFPFRKLKKDEEYKSLYQLTLEILQKQKSSIFKYVRIFKDTLLIIEREIICEAVDYLTRKSSESLLDEIIEWVYRTILITQRKQEKLTPNPKILPDELISGLVEALSSVRWMDKFMTISQVQIERKGKNFLSPNSFIEEVRGSKKSIYVYQGHLLLGEVKGFYVQNEVRLGTFFLGGMEKTAAKRKEFFHLKRINQDSYSFIPKGQYFKIFENILANYFVASMNASLKKAVNEKYKKFDFNYVLTDSSRLILSKPLIEFLRSGEADILFESDASDKDEVATIRLKEKIVESRFIYSRSFFYLRPEIEISDDDFLIEAVERVVERVYFSVFGRRNQVESKA